MRLILVLLLRFSLVPVVLGINFVHWVRSNFRSALISVSARNWSPLRSLQRSALNVSSTTQPAFKEITTARQ